MGSNTITVIEIKLIKALVHRKLSRVDLDIWKTRFIPSLYILPKERTLHHKIKEEVLASAVTASEIFLAWVILDCIESAFSREVQNGYVNGNYEKSA